MLIEDYVMPDINSLDERVDCLECLFDDHHLLLAGFWNRIMVMVKNKKYSLIPTSLFLPDNLQDYIHLNTKVDPSLESFFHFSHPLAGLTNVFAVNKGVIHFLTQQTYPSKTVHFFHQSSSFIHGYQRYFDSTSGNAIALYLDRFVMHITYIRDGQFQFYNQYPIKKFDDYFRFMGYVVNEFSIDPNEDSFYVWGYLSKNSKHFNSLQARYPTLKMGERPADITMSYVFDEIPEQHYFDLLAFNHLS
jgi:hypothetical protein